MNRDYNRETKEDLIRLYSTKSKHSNYQILPNQLRKLLNVEDVVTSTRYEHERLNYLLSKVDVRNKSVLDIGANTGYFSFELLDAGAKKVHYYEGNAEHAQFVDLAVRSLELQNVMTVTNDYYPFDGSDTSHYDVVLLFNVLHHVGDDYGDKKLTVEEAREEILNQLNFLASNCDSLVLQLGFNWQGDTSRPLFERGTKKEMIEFVRSNINSCWDISAIGIAQVTDKSIEYKDLDESNIERNDSMGEFLNRPILILKSKVRK